MKFDYEKEYKNQIKKNISKVKQELNSASMKLKIENWAAKFGYTFEEVYKKIESDPMFQCVFSKDPAKQNIYETLALSFIKSIPNVSDAEKDGKTYILEGKPSKTKISAKSVDFTWISAINGEEHKCYASHKYTKNSGGAQDNQYNNLKAFINGCRSTQGTIEKGLYFFAICDGDYYTPSKCEEMKNLAPKNLFVGSTQELYKFLTQKWDKSLEKY